MLSWSFTYNELKCMTVCFSNPVSRCWSESLGLCPFVLSVVFLFSLQYSTVSNSQSVTRARHTSQLLTTWHYDSNVRVQTTCVCISTYSLVAILLVTLSWLGPCWGRHPSWTGRVFCWVLREPNCDRYNNVKGYRGDCNGPEMWEVMEEEEKKWERVG